MFLVFAIIDGIEYTLILDEEGIYDPNDFNDRMLLGLKGTMSEAELHFLHSRLRGGLLNKAKRGELKVKLPIGFSYDPRGNVTLDPEQQVRESINLFFKTYLRLGSAMATVTYFRKNNLLFPRRNNGGPQHGEIVWGCLEFRRAPCPASAFFLPRKPPSQPRSPRTDQ